MLEISKFVFCIFEEVMSKEKKNKKVVEEPSVVYQTNRITFSTMETQGDIQLKYSISITPIERLQLMRKLNDYAYKQFLNEKVVSNNTKLIFTSYEYIPR